MRLRTTQNNRLDYHAELIFDNKVIGCIGFRQNFEKGSYEDWFDLSLMLDDVFSEFYDEALETALEYAFTEIGAASVHCCFEKYNTIAVQALYNSGFTVENEERHLLRFVITSKQYSIK